MRSLLVTTMMGTRDTCTRGWYLDSNENTVQIPTVVCDVYLYNVYTIYIYIYIYIYIILYTLYLLAAVYFILYFHMYSVYVIFLCNV